MKVVLFVADFNTDENEVVSYCVHDDRTSGLTVGVTTAVTERVTSLLTSNR